MLCMVWLLIYLLRFLLIGNGISHSLIAANVKHLEVDFIYGCGFFMFTASLNVSKNLGALGFLFRTKFFIVVGYFYHKLNPQPSRAITSPLTC